MKEQMCMDMMISDEQRAFELVYPEIQSVIFNAPIDSGILLFQEISNSSSVYFLDQGELFFRIRFRKKARYILISEEYESLLPPNAVISKSKSDAGMVRISIDTYEDILKYVPVLRHILERLCRKNRDFGCCGRYEECSNVKKCIHPDPKSAIRCWYRYNMLDGKIFYGKHKNI